MAKKVNFRDLSIEELREKLFALDKELLVANMQKETRALKDTGAIRRTKKDIARIKTILRERQNA